MSFRPAFTLRAWLQTFAPVALLPGNEVKNKFLFSGIIYQFVGPVRQVAGYMLLVLTCLLGLSGTLLAQTPDTTRQRPVIRPGVPARTDTLTPKMATENAALLVDSLLVDSDTDSVSTDTVQLSDKVNAEIRKIVPKRAALLSLALPGLGQIYNGQKWKAPVIYAGFGTFGYFIVTYTGNYQTYLTAYRTASAMTVNPVTQAPITDPREKTAVVNGRPLDLNQLKQGTDFWRRWRDYNIIFTALFWGLNVVDANVTAHLKTFDLSDSLTLKYSPTVIPSPSGFVPGVKLTMNFKK
ncbi:DUF5683 domain-containing protein [Fibrivirga algicola]|uniref:DUF5683 domain-containing protein n=1 Tax=Fibrivirga algicola TaxID=2950420 RepID=A0ABX0QE13_9BACT|nr:DUF5683 domain-containing protein [Fibrivirga algicola]NID09337.1 hypothetical protein [Fibrivirga algicola]